MMSNSGIVAAGRNTRFGQPGAPDPKAARAGQVVNPSSLRAALRRLMACPVVLDIPLGDQLTVDRLVGFLSHGRPCASLAILAAVTVYQQALKDGHVMIKMIDLIDGRL